MRLLRFVARDLPGLVPVDLEFSDLVAFHGCPRTTARLLRAIWAAAEGAPSAGSVMLETCGPASLPARVGDEVTEEQRTELHGIWARLLRARDPRGKKLRHAWRQLWGSGGDLSELGVSRGPVVSLTVGGPSRPAGMSLEARALQNQGSGCCAAFDLLGRLVLLDRPDLLLLDYPDRCLHPLVARRLFSALRVAVPETQIVAVVRSAQACWYLDRAQVLDTSTLRAS